MTSDSSAQPSTTSQDVVDTGSTPPSDPLAIRRAQLAQRRALLSTLKQHVLAERILRQAEPRARLRVSAIPRRASDQPTPLSFSQERVWALEQQDPTATQYHISQVEYISGPFNRAAFEQSIKALIQRHEILRTRIVVQDGQPYQVAQEDGQIAIPFLDLQPVPIAEREQAARKLMSEVQQPFDLMGGSLMRVGLVQLEAEVHVAFLMLHQLVCDGWSVAVLAREFATLYAAFVAGDSAPPPLAIQYADYAVWQRERLHGERLERQLAYWTKQLAGAAPLRLLRAGRPAPTIRSRQGIQIDVVVPEPLHQALQALSTQSNATLFMTLLSALHILLSRLSGQHDIVVGTPVAGRTRPELEGLIGCFVNLLSLRVDLSDNRSFRGLLQDVQRIYLDADAHQELPFSLLAAAIHPGMPLTDTALFQVVFDLQTVSAPAEKPIQLESNPIRESTQSCPFDLFLTLNETPNALRGMLVCSTDLFDAHEVEQVWQQFLALLEAIVATPDQPVLALRHGLTL